MLVITLLALSLVTISITQAAGPAKIVKGTIVSIDPNSGMLEVKNQEGKTFMLNADPQTDDLKTLQKGDQVMIQFDKDKVVQSINKEG